MCEVCVLYSYYVICHHPEIKEVCACACACACVRARACVRVRACACVRAWVYEIIIRLEDKFTTKILSVYYILQYIFNYTF